MPLVERMKRILLTPRTEWETIDRETVTASALFTGYILPLAAIGPIAQLIGISVFGMSIPFQGTYRVPFGSALASAIVTLVLTLAGTYILALVIDGLAPRFDGRKNPIQALKVAAYSSTASWVAGIFAIIPNLRFLGIVGLYSLYLLYLGLPVLMNSPPEKALGYTVVVMLAGIVLFFVVGAVASRFVGLP